MNKKRSYTKRFTQDETIAIIRARIKLNHLFSEKRFNLRKAWEAVGREAKVEVQHQWLHKKWANLLAIYKKCLEFPNGDGAVTSDGELSAASWVYFQEMDNWASNKDENVPTELTSEVFNTLEGAHENENIATIDDEDLDKSLAIKSTLMYSPVTQSGMPLSTSEDAVSHLLQSWGLSDLKAKFKANYIVLQAFEYLTEEDIIELIPKIGQRAIFRGRLQEWRKQNGIAIKQPNPLESPQLSPQHQAVSQQSPPPADPPMSMIKLEPVEDYTETHTQPKALDKISSSPKLRVLLPKPQTHQEVSGSYMTQPTPKLVHKIYGTLRKCNQKPGTPKPSAMQSKVKQFYISPAVEPISPSCTLPPSPPLPQSPAEVPSSDVVRADFGPFVTSIIRVETNCDKTYQKNLSSVNPPTKVNRTTILQKLTSPSSTQVSPQDYAAQKYKPPQRYKPRTPSAPPAKQRKLTKHTEAIQPDSCPLYPIVKLEPESIDMDWNESTESLSEPERNIKPEPDTEPESVHNESAENVIPDSTGFQAEFIESLESNSTQQLPHSGDESNSISKLKRIAPEVFRKSRKRHAKVMGKLDIRRILLGSEQGQHVLDFYESYEVLDISRRRQLIDAICQYCWLINKRILPADCNRIADEIIEIFPNEKREDYYCQEPGKSPKSPLYTKYRNMGRNFFVTNNLPIPERMKRKQDLSILEVEDIEVDDSFIIS